MYKAFLLPRAEKQLRKLKDRHLIREFRECLREVCEQPFRKSKVGDLQGVWAHGFSYRGTSYRVAYFIDREERNAYVNIINIKKLIVRPAPGPVVTAETERCKK